MSFEFEKLWDVEADSEAQDRDDVVARRPRLRVIVERVADREVSGTKVKITKVRLGLFWLCKIMGFVMIFYVRLG